MASSSSLSDEDQLILDQNIQLRQTLISKLTKGGDIPGQSGDKILLLGLLDGTDRAILSRAKIKAEEKSTESMAQTRAMVANLLLDIRPNTVPEGFRRIDALPSDIRRDNDVVGNMDMGTIVLDASELS